MRMALLNTKNTARAKHLMDCFAEGVRRHGDDPVFVYNMGDLESLREVDVAAQICYPNRHTKGSKEGEFRLAVNKALHDRGCRVLTIDTGFVRNQIEAELTTTDKRPGYGIHFDVENPATYEAVCRQIYYQIGYDGLKRTADYCIPSKVSGDRWRALDTPIKAWRKRGDHIVILGQRLFGLSSQHVNVFKWYRDVIQTLRRFTRRTIVFREHPSYACRNRNTKNTQKRRKENYQILGRPSRLIWSDNRNLADDLHNAWAVVGFTTNASVAAVLEGIPLFAGDPGNVAWPVANHDFTRIESPTFPDRQDWAHRLAYSQWNAAEMRDGTAWEHLRPRAKIS